MGDVTTPSSLLLRLTDAVAALLSPTERRAVLGDLAELQVTAGDALLHVTGLVVRRQLQLVCSVPGFIATFLIALPLGALLAARASHWAAGAGVYLWAYAHYGDVQSLARTMWRTGDITGVQLFSWALLNGATLAVWSCAAGWALGVFARRGIWLSVVAFYGMVVVASSLHGGIDHLPGHPAFAAFGFVGVATAVHSALLVIAPALWALRWSLRARRIPGLVVVLFAVAGALLTYRAA